MLNSLSGLIYAGLLGGAVYLGMTYGIYQRDYVEGLEQQVLVLEKDNTTLRSNQSILEQVNLENTQTIQRIQRDQAQRQREYDALKASADENRARVEGFVKMFQEHNFGDLVNRKPGLMENIINRGTQRALSEVREATSRPPVNNTNTENQNE